MNEAECEDHNSKTDVRGAIVLKPDGSEWARGNRCSYCREEYRKAGFEVYIRED